MFIGVTDGFIPNLKQTKSSKMSNYLYLNEL